MADTEQKGSKGRGSCIIYTIITLIVIVSMITLIIYAVKITREDGKFPGVSSPNTDGAGKLLSRSANNGDISFEISDEFSLNINILITPKIDIKNLQMTFEFTDENKNPITTKTHILGNVTKGLKYTVTYKLSDFSFSQMFKIGGVSAQVTGGTVSYFS